MKIWILGCGPAGLMAAHAASTSGAEVKILSQKRKSEMFGCQYLHKPIPGISEGHGTLVDYTLRGTAAGYRQKVYGERWDGSVSGDDLLGRHYAWDIRSAYDALWRRYSPFVEQMDGIGPGMMGIIVREAEAEGAQLFSSIPAPAICKDKEKHSFLAERVWSIGDAPERGIFSPVTCEENEIICNGFDSPSWYRVSNVFGYHTTEWPWRDGKKPPIEGVSEVIKPLKTTCTCFPTVNRIGRYGQWTKGILSHSAFDDMIRMTQEVLF